MAVEQKNPEIPHADRIDLDPPTEAELCTRGAVKITHIRLAEVTNNYHGVQIDLHTERQKTESLTAALNSRDTELQSLRPIFNPPKYRDVIVRLVEVAIVVLLSYAIDFLKSGDTKTFTVFAAVCIILLIVIVLIQWAPHRSPENK